MCADIENLIAGGAIAMREQAMLGRGKAWEVPPQVLRSAAAVRGEQRSVLFERRYLVGHWRSQT